MKTRIISVGAALCLVASGSACAANGAAAAIMLKDFWRGVAARQQAQARQALPAGDRTQKVKAEKAPSLPPKAHT